jgi:hypothetical protein
VVAAAEGGQVASVEVSGAGLVLDQLDAALLLGLVPAAFERIGVQLLDQTADLRPDLPRGLLCGPRVFFVLALAVAISVAFPLFLIVRERRLAAAG